MQQVRLLCEDLVSTSWLGGKRGQAQAASDLLDEANALLAEFDSSAVAAPAPPPPPPPPAPEPAAPKLPAETFFLSADKVRECLTLNIDSSILVRQQAVAAQREAGARRGGWPLGKKRKVDGGSQSAGSGKLAGWLSGLQLACDVRARACLECNHNKIRACVGACMFHGRHLLLALSCPAPPFGAGKRKAGRHYNPWTPELQQQLATVLRLALRCGSGALRLCIVLPPPADSLNTCCN